MDDYLTKPIKRSVLELMLARWLRSSTPMSPGSAGNLLAGSASETDTTEPSLDEAVLVQLSELMTDGLADIIDTYMRDTSAQMAAMDTALEQGDLALLGRSAHSLKSSSAAVGAVVVRSTSQALETYARAGSRIEEAAQLVASVRAAFEAVKPQIEAFISAKNTRAPSLRAISTDGEKMLVLLVEDDPVTRRRMTALLDNAGYAVDAVSDGIAALDKMSERYYPILVTDWEMPRLDGIGLCQAVRNLTLDGYVYTLLLTGRDAKDHIIAGLEAGADDYLVKPVHEPELIARLNAGRRILTLEHSLKASSDRNRMLIENTSAVPWELDRDSCRIIYLAPQVTTLFALAQEALSAPGSFTDLLHADDREAFRQFVKRETGSEGDSRDYIDSRIATTGQQARYVRSFIASQRNSSRTQRVCGISLDITQQKSLELERVQAQKLESVGRLAAGVAHEINTPVQFISDNVEFVRASMISVI